MYDNNGRILGPLTGGPDVPCGSNQDFAMYGKLNDQWFEINQFLDPTNSGLTFFDGTYNNVISGCTDPNALNFNPDATLDDDSCEYMLGDVSGDNIVDILDVVQIVNMVTGNVTSVPAADINDDDIINILDIVLVVNIILGN